MPDMVALPKVLRAVERGPAEAAGPPEPRVEDPELSLLDLSCISCTAGRGEERQGGSGGATYIVKVGRGVAFERVAPYL